MKKVYEVSWYPFGISMPRLRVYEIIKETPKTYLVKTAHLKRNIRIRKQTTDSQVFDSLKEARWFALKKINEMRIQIKNQINELNRMETEICEWQDD